MLFTVQVNVPRTSDGGKNTVRMVSYLAVVPSMRYCVILNVLFVSTASPSFIQDTFVGGDPREEQLIAKAVVEASCRATILIGAIKRNTSHYFPANIELPTC